MARRLFNGRAFSEDGWPYVDEGSCTWIVVPGTDPPVHLEIQQGPPLPIMTAVAADFNAYVEHLNDPDSACWTPGNSVATSNHPGGTAMDLNWLRHQFQVVGTFNAAQQATIREIVDFYEGMIGWAGPGYWSGGPVDEMHWQMGYGTYDQANDRPFPKVFDFINRKIRSDGFSTLRRGNAPPPPTLTRAERYALAIIAEGQRLGITPRGIIIGLSVGLVETNLTMYANSNDPESLNFPHDAVGSDHMSVGWAQQQPNWGSLSCRMDITCAATLFFTCDNGPGTRGLTKIRDRTSGADGPLYDYNSTAHSMGFYAQKVQGSEFPDRYDQRMGEATDLYNRLVGITAPPPQPTEGFLMALSDQQQQDLYNAIMKQRQSRSPLREPGEGDVGDTPDQIWDMDGSIHILVVDLLAKHGIPSQIELLQRVAANQLPDRQQDALLAQAILGDLDAPAPVPARAPVQAASTYVPATVAVKALAETFKSDPTAGELIGNLYDALEKLRLADALPIEGRAPLAALISVLQTKNGSQL